MSAVPIGCNVIYINQNQNKDIHFSNILCEGEYELEIISSLHQQVGILPTDLPE